MKTIRGDLSNFGFLETPAPRMQVFCYVPRIGLNTQVDFLIDTGACESCLNGSLALGLQQYMQKSTLQVSTGIGGQCGYYREVAVLIFTDTRGQLIDREIELGIQRIKCCLWKRPDDSILFTPSLMGRDILSQWELQYDHKQGQVLLIVP